MKFCMWRVLGKPVGYHYKFQIYNFHFVKNLEYADIFVTHVNYKVKVESVTYKSTETVEDK